MGLAKLVLHAWEHGRIMRFRGWRSYPVWQ